MSWFGLGQSADISITLEDSETRKVGTIRSEEGQKEQHYLFYDGESVTGTVKVHLKKPGQKLEHQGIKIEFIGQIEVYYDRGNHHDFISLVKDLARPGELLQSTSYRFDFQQVEKPYESYVGANVKLRYFLRVTIVRRLTDLVREMDLIVATLATYPETNTSIKMEVGIEDCLHIEFEYNRSKYHLKDVIVGKIYFLLVRIKIKHMEVAIIKRETVGTGPNIFNENETIAKYEIMDGAPVRGESIPIRLFLAGYELTPTMREINKRFSVRYYLNLVLVDEDDRRYFKQQEIVLWRKAEGISRGGGHPQTKSSLPAPVSNAPADNQTNTETKTAPAQAKVTKSPPQTPPMLREPPPSNVVEDSPPAEPTPPEKSPKPTPNANPSPSTETAEVSPSPNSHS